MFSLDQSVTPCPIVICIKHLYINLWVEIYEDLVHMRNIEILSMLTSQTYPTYSLDWSINPSLNHLCLVNLSHNSWLVYWLVDVLVGFNSSYRGYQRINGSFRCINGSFWCTLTYPSTCSGYITFRCQRLLYFEQMRDLTDVLIAGLGVL